MYQHGQSFRDGKLYREIKKILCSIVWSDPLNPITDNDKECDILAAHNHASGFMLTQFDMTMYTCLFHVMLDYLNVFLY